MFAIPDVALSTLWSEALEGFELHLMSLGRSGSQLRNRLYSVRALARHSTASGHEPAGVTPRFMQSYLLAQYADRKGTGRETLFQELKNFWAWYSGSYEAASPMEGIPWPGGQSAVVPVLEPAKLPAVLKACKGQDERETARNLAIIWLLLESGLRRFELCGLDLDNVDLKGRTVSVRRGKGSRARVAVFGDEMPRRSGSGSGSAGESRDRCSRAAGESGSPPAGCRSCWRGSRGDQVSGSGLTCSGTPGRTTRWMAGCASTTSWNWLAGHLRQC